jgi:hypothetical protein
VQVGDVIHFTDIFKFPVIEQDGERLLILQEADVCFIEEREAHGPDHRSPSHTNRIRTTLLLTLYALAEHEIGLRARYLVPNFTTRRGVHLVAP